MPVVAVVEAAPEVETEVAAPSFGMRVQPATQGIREEGPNKIEDVTRCPVDGAYMQKANAGLRNVLEIPVYVCTQHRVCLPAPDTTLPTTAPTVTPTTSPVPPTLR